MLLIYLFETVFKELLIMKDNISRLLMSNFSLSDSTVGLKISRHIQSK